MIVMQSTDTVRPISEQRPVFIVKDDGKVEPEGGGVITPRR